MATSTVSKFITIVLIEDHEAMRRGVENFIKTDPSINIVGEAAGTEEAMDLIYLTQPDVALLDIRLRQGSGIEVVRNLEKLSPTTRALIYTAFDDDYYLNCLIRLGICGYVLKSSPVKEVLNAIHDVAEGRLVFSREISHKVLNVLRHGQHDLTIKQTEKAFTPREYEVLSNLAKGLRDREIAEALGISSRTVEAHIRSILRKSGTSSRTQVLLWAAQEGLL